MSEKLKFSNDGSCEKALKAFRTAEGDNFLVFGYADKTSLNVVAEGKGSLAECQPHLPNNECRYILMKKDVKVEMAKTVKFALVDWTPDAIPPLKRALLSTHKGQLKELLGSVHVSMPASDTKDLDEAALMSKINASAGIASNVTDKAATGPKVEVKKGTSGRASVTDQKSPSKAQTPSVAQGGPGLKLSDDFADAIKSVRDGKDGTTWMMARSADKGTSLNVVEKGQGSVDDLQAKLEDDNCNFVLIRVTEQVDKSTTVKFVFVKWQAEALAPMTKAAISVRKGEIEKAFSPFHINLQISHKNELTQQLVQDKVAAASGQKSNVKA